MVQDVDFYNVVCSQIVSICDLGLADESTALFMVFVGRDLLPSLGLSCS